MGDADACLSLKVLMLSTDWNAEWERIMSALPSSLDHLAASRLPWTFAFQLDGGQSACVLVEAAGESSVQLLV